MHYLRGRNIAALLYMARSLEKLSVRSRTAWWSVLPLYLDSWLSVQAETAMRLKCDCLQAHLPASCAGRDSSQIRQVVTPHFWSWNWALLGSLAVTCSLVALSGDRRFLVPRFRMFSRYIRCYRCYRCVFLFSPCKRFPNLGKQREPPEVFKAKISTLVANLSLVFSRRLDGRLQPLFVHSVSSRKLRECHRCGLIKGKCLDLSKVPGVQAV